MISFSKYDIIVVKFPFASSLKYKARPAVVISSNIYNESSRNTLLIMAISSSKDNKLDIELDVINWNKIGLLKPSIFKSAVATIEQDFVIQKLGKLDKKNIQRLRAFKIPCQSHLVT